VDSGTDSLLEGAYGTLNLTNVTVRGNHMHVDREDVLTDTFKFVVGMNVMNREAASMIQTYDRFGFAEDGGLGLIGDLTDSAETNFSRDGVKKNHALDKEEIHA
jgi:hypothetical protein